VWWRKKNPERELLSRFLDLERIKLDHHADLQAKRDEIELRKLEIEMNHLEARTKADIELQKARQELREKRRAIGRASARKRWDREKGINPQGDAGDCPLCVNPFYRGPGLTIALIRAHDAHIASREAAPAAPGEVLN
jgi:hypothetical protein